MITVKHTTPDTGSSIRSDMQERYCVSASAVRLRRLLGVGLGPFVGAMQLLRLYVSGSFTKVGILVWVGLLAVVVFVTWVAIYGARGWIKWAANHRLEIADDGLVLVDGDERELRAFSDIARLDVRKLAGTIIRVRLTYAGGLKQDLSFYEKVSDLVAVLKSHLPPDRVHE
jgi:hypothetical protein